MADVPYKSREMVAPDMVESGPIHATVDAYLEATEQQASTNGITKLETIREGGGDDSDKPSMVDVVTVLLGEWSFGSGSSNATSQPQDPSEEVQDSGKRVLRMGAGLLPRGVELAISTMRKGERSKFRIYRHAGSAGVGPAAVVDKLDTELAAKEAKAASGPSAELWKRWHKLMASNGHVDIEVELMKYKSPQDIQGDGGLLKYFKKHGEGIRAAESKIRATFKVISSNGKCIVDKSDETATYDLHRTAIADASQFLLRTDHRSLGVEVIEESIRSVLRTMRVGEDVFCVMRPEYCFGGDGHNEYEIGPDCSATMTAVLHHIETNGSATTKEASPEEKIDEATALKTKGTAFFKAGDYISASKWYGEVISVLEQDFMFIPELRETSRGLKLAASLNISMCQLKLEMFEDVIGICTEIIKQDPQCVKAHFRMGKAHQGLDEFGAAITCFDKALAIDSSLIAAIKAKEECRVAQSKQNAADKERFKNLFK